jgi:hypothetical protein
MREPDLCLAEETCYEEAAVCWKHHQAVEARLAMAEDAAAKGDLARQTAGGMELEIAELKARLAEAERDAARYRWLREQHWSKSAVAVVASPKQAVKLGHDCPSDERLDAFIDGLMATADSATPASSGDATKAMLASSASGAFPTPGPQVCPRCGVVKNAACVYSWHQVNAVTVSASSASGLRDGEIRDQIGRDMKATSTVTGAP